MKHVVFVILAVAAVVEAALFFGIGFGSGALAIDNGPASTAANYQVSQALEGGSWGDGLSFAVNITSTSASGAPVITAMLSGFQSTQVIFALNMYSKGDCGNTGQPAFFPGTSANYGYYDVQYLVGGNPIAWSGLVDGSPATSNSAGNYYVTTNSSGLSAWCSLTGGGGDSFKNGLGVAGTAYQQHVLAFSGILAPGTVKITYSLQLTLCGGSGGGMTGVCAAVQSACGANCIGGGTPNGARTLQTSASVSAYSAGASVTITDPHSLYNGNFLDVNVQTGYDGPNGYVLQVLCPQARSCGGQADPAFPSQTVKNFDIGSQVQWQIPAAYAVNNSNPFYNQIVVVLLANYGVAAQSLAYPVNVNPIYNPAQPAISVRSSSGNLYPLIGDTVTASIWANATSTSKPISNITLQVFYLTAGAGSTSAPPCGSYWVTNNCPFGQGLSIQISGSNAFATYSFQVQPPLGVTAIVLSATGYTSTGQGNVSNPFYLPIRPPGCTPGTACDPAAQNIGAWGIAGPILLSALIITVALAVAFAPGLERLSYWRYVVVVVAVGAVVVLFVVGFQAWFQPGGILGGPPA